MSDRKPCLALKTLFRAILIGVALLGSAGDLLFAQTPPTEHAVSEKQEGQSADRDAADMEVNRALANYPLWLALFTGALVIATIFLGCIAYLQWADTRITQRAYVSVAPLGVMPLSENSVAHISVQNVGKLPASDVSWFIGYAIDNDGTRSTFDIDENEFYGKNLVIHPGAAMPRSQNCRMDAVALAALKRRPDRLTFFYLWGKIRYLDGFGKQRHTSFCHRYDCRGVERYPEGQRYPGQEWLITPESMRYHQFGNDAD